MQRILPVINGRVTEILDLTLPDFIEHYLYLDSRLQQSEYAAPIYQYNLDRMAGIHPVWARRLTRTIPATSLRITTAAWAYPRRILESYPAVRFNNGLIVVDLEDSLPRFFPSAKRLLFSDQETVLETIELGEVAVSRLALAGAWKRTTDYWNWSLLEQDSRPLVTALLYD